MQSLMRGLPRINEQQHSVNCLPTVRGISKRGTLHPPTTQWRRRRRVRLWTVTRWLRDVENIANSSQNALGLREPTQLSYTANVNIVLQQTLTHTAPKIANPPPATHPPKQDNKLSVAKRGKQMTKLVPNKTSLY